jgi:hypothetical protein
MRRDHGHLLGQRPYDHSLASIDGIAACDPDGKIN